jgi:DNA-binding beta-propeller fold protein YncE
LKVKGISTFEGDIYETSKWWWRKPLVSFPNIINKFEKVYEDISGSEKYGGGVLGPNGNIYTVPFKATHILEIDSRKNLISEIEIIDNGNNILDMRDVANQQINKYLGGIVAQNGKIYFIPYDAQGILVFDPYTREHNILQPEAINLSGLAKYAGGILTPEGKIYCVPHDASNILIIDTENNDNISIIDLSNYSILFDINQNGKWYGGAIDNEAKIYCSPNNLSFILTIDTQNNDNLDFIPTFNNNKYNGAVFSPNGNIYFIPNDISNVLIYNTITDKVMLNHITDVSGSYKGGILSNVNGYIYCIPSNTDKLLIIDPNTNTINEKQLNDTVDYLGGVINTDGNIYCIPHNTLKIGVVKPSELSISLGTWPLSSYFNKL